MRKCPCGKYSVYGFLNNKKPTCCNDCKKDGMIDIINKKCSCGKRPSFGFPNNKTPTCCSKCKKDGMVSLDKRKCTCGKAKPYFGFPDDEKATCCSQCKEENMVNIISKKCKCGKAQPYFGFPDDEKATCCASCKKEGIMDIKNKQCKANEQDIQCPQRCNEKYDGYCTHCFANLFPSDPRTQQIRKKSKELQIVSYISSENKDFLHDKPLYVDLNGGCCSSRRRIDLRILINNTLLCIEIDEKQHRGYDKEDERNRYDNLYMDFSGKYIFIRYNPDPYKDKKGKKRNPHFETRMGRLKEEIEKQMERIEKGKNRELLEIIHIYYDEE